VAVVVVGAAHVDEPRGLLLNRLDHLGVAVARRADGDARVAVEEDVAVHVLDPHAGAFLGDELEGRARVRGRHPLRVPFDDLLTLRAGQSLGLDLRPLRYRGSRHDLSPLVKVRVESPARN
jgi:hypothetical protein